MVGKETAQDGCGRKLGSHPKELKTNYERRKPDATAGGGFAIRNGGTGSAE
jgi:hypothetical protein